MPYIPKDQRAVIDNLVDMLLQQSNGNIVRGQLNYFLNKLYVEYEKEIGRNYNNMKEFVGEVLMAVHEIQRRRVDPYEDIKARQNGDVE